MGNRTDAKVIRERMTHLGKTYSDIARELGVNRSTVVKVVSGKLKGSRGDAHKVAVSLGLKDGVVVEAGTSVADALKLVAGR